MLAGDVERLGQVDPSVEPYRSMQEKSGATVIDLTKIEMSDGLNHSKFAQTPEIVKLIGSRIIAGQKITEHDVNLGDRIGAVILGTQRTMEAATRRVAATSVAGD